MGTNLTEALKKTSLYIFLGLLAYMPLHIFVSTWLGTSFGVLDFAKVFKDGVLVLGFLIVLGLSIRQPWFKPLLKDKLLWLILAYAGLTVLLAIIKPTDQDAKILGVVYNTRFLLFFLYAVLLVKLLPKAKIQREAVKTVLVVGGIVITFGIIQYLFLPNDALTHTGYSRENGVLPAFFIDDKPDLERAMSTLRDPNSLGSYLIIIGALAAGVLAATKRRITERRLAVYIALTTLCLWFSFSRSAALGALLAAAVFLFLSQDRLVHMVRKHQNELIAGTLVVVVLLAGILFINRDSYLVQNVILHSDQSTVLEDPNELRLRFWKESIAASVLVPEGTGPGTAGLASIKNDVQGTTLNENYYLQLLTEVGVVGLALFVAILVVVARRLYWLRQSQLAIALLVSFAGLAVTNFLLHIWTNEAVAYTWWGMAGIAIGVSLKNMKTKETK